MLCIKEIESYISSHSWAGSGCDCKFYMIGDIGIKTWRWEKDAIHCHNIQAILHSLGFAPEVLSNVFKVEDYEGMLRWGFQTEVITPLFISLKEQYGSDWREIFYEQQNNEYDEWTDWKSELLRNGWYDYDDHTGNYGYDKNGQFKCLDTGSLSYDIDNHKA